MWEAGRLKFSSASNSAEAKMDELEHPFSTQERLFTGDETIHQKAQKQKELLSRISSLLRKDAVLCPKITRSIVTNPTFAAMLVEFGIDCCLDSSLVFTSSTRWSKTVEVDSVV